MGDNKRNSFKYICSEIVDLHERKNSDYGNSFSRNIKKYGLLAGLIPIANKFHRLEQLIINGNNKVKSESIEDTLIDNASYCIMLLAEIREMNKEKYVSDIDSIVKQNVNEYISRKKCVETQAKNMKKGIWK